MKILDRYLLRSLMVPFFYCFAAFSGIFMIWELFNDLAKILDAGTSGWVVTLYYVAILLPSLEYLLPASLMLGTLYALWHLTRTNELMAMQASGVGFARLMLPCLGFGLVASLVMGGIKETLGVRAYVWTKELRDNKFREEMQLEAPTSLAYLDARARRFWMIDRFDERTPHVLDGVKITEERLNRSRVRDLIAIRAEWLDGRWWFYDLKVQYYDADDNPIGSPVALSPGPRAVKEMPLITENPAQFVRATRDWHFLPTWDMWRYLREHTELSEKAAHEKWYDIHNRLASPWACLVATLFAIPAGAKTGRHNPLTGIFTAVGFFFAYYALSQVGLLLGKSGALPAWIGAWLSNFVFLISGMVMITRLR